jgi:peptidoglycan/xylan/chitin deacetylase (PgdA/CDA1 family)
MNETFVLLGFDVERPYVTFVDHHEEYRQLSTELNTILSINAQCNLHQVPRTFFILGSFLEKAKTTRNLVTLQQVFESSNKEVDLESHAYAHRPFVAIPTRPDLTVLHPTDYGFGIRDSRRLISYVFEGIKQPIGIRAPYGYTGGLRHASREVIDSIVGVGIKFISSDLRDKDSGINAPLVEDGKLRQPYRYDWTNLWEIPTHGWQDTAFTGTSKTCGTTGYPTTVDAIAEHYLEIVGKGTEISKSEGKDIFIGLCWHPWAIAQYDPGLQVLEQVVAGSKDMGAKFMSYRGAYEQLRNPAKG